MGVGTANAELLAALPAGGGSGLELMHRTGLHSGVVYPSLTRLERAGLITPSPGTPRRYRRTAGNAPARMPNRQPQALGPQPRALGPQRQEPDRQPPTLDRTPSWLPALLAAVVTGYAVLVRPGGLTDLGVYLGAASGLRNGTSLYDFISGTAPFTYPP
ncbi:MAG: alpha,2-mannosyltransferase, partial [Actinoplanes sp.]|nr:alpha,2-mannosyltransferase [Actinoplanes sp.]